MDKNLAPQVILKLVKAQGEIGKIVFIEKSVG